MRTDIPSRCWLQMAFDRCHMGRWFAGVDQVLTDPIMGWILTACARDIEAQAARDLRRAA
jgi:hypothetical protein